MSAKPRSPDEAVRIREIAELAEDAHAVRFLPLDEVRLEHGDQRLARARMQRVLPELDYRALVIHRRDCR